MRVGPSAGCLPGLSMITVLDRRRVAAERAGPERQLSNLRQFNSFRMVAPPSTAALLFVIPEVGGRREGGALVRRPEAGGRREGRGPCSSTGSGWPQRGRGPCSPTGGGWPQRGAGPLFVDRRRVAAESAGPLFVDRRRVAAERGGALVRHSGEACPGSV
jgi:hypothetical protein